MGSANRPTRPVLRYHSRGGKWRIAPWIIQHFPPHRVYVEPFGGAASVLLRKPRAYAEVYGDMDGEVCNVFRVLRDSDAAAQLEAALRLTPYARAEFLLSYEMCADPIEQARRTIVRALAGFGSAAASGHQTGFRANSNRSHTTPAMDFVAYPDLISSFTDRLRGVVVENRPAAHLILQHDGPETLFYVDPPYPRATRSSLGHYDGAYRYEMTDEDHRTLAAVLRRVGGMVVLSGYPCDLYDQELYPDWHRVERAAMADGARRRTEVLWLNKAAAEAQGQVAIPLFGKEAA